MSIRRKTIFVVLFTVSVLMGILHLSLKYFVLSGFSKVEIDLVKQNIGRVQDAISQSLTTLSMKSADWAKWDDTYEFINNFNSQYIRSNLTSEAIKDLDLSMMIFINSKGELVSGFEKDSTSDSVHELSNSEFYSIIPKDSPLLSYKCEDTVYSGIIRVANSIMYIVSRPILKSNGSGPSVGTLIFTRYIDNSTIQGISQLTHLIVEIECISRPLLSIEYQRAKKSITHEAPYYINPVNNDVIEGIFVQNDLFNQPLLFIKASMNRSIFKQGYKTYLYLIYFSIFAALLISIFSVLLLDNSVLIPLKNLALTVRDIGKNTNKSIRIPVKGNNEFSYLGHSINAMLESIYISEKAIHNKNNDMKAIMDALPSGLLCLDERLIIKDEYSRAVESIFGRKNIAGKSFPEMIFPSEELKSDKEKLIEFLEVLRQDIFPEKELATLNPFEKILISKTTGTAWIKLEYHLMKHDKSGENSILVDIQDITESILLEKRIKSSEELNTQLKIIVEDPELFKYFLFEISETIENAATILNDSDLDKSEHSSLTSLFKQVHTIKGTAGSFGLNIVANIADELETVYSNYKKQIISPEMFISQSRLLLDDAAKTVLDSTINFRNIVGEEYFDTLDLFVKLPLSRLHSLHRTTVDAIRQQNLSIIDSIDSEFKRLREVTARRGFAKTLKSIPLLTKRFEKNISFTFNGLDIPIDYQISHDLNTALIHLIRNAFDHGIEYPEERLLLDKPTAGHVEIRLNVTDDQILLEIEDDGRGIDIEKIRELAIQNKFISSDESATFSKKDLMSLIFKPGFSTSETVDDISGRGIGMSAVLDTITNLHGQINIQSEKNKGTCFSINVPKNLYYI